jgi:hypothetical protein
MSGQTQPSPMQLFLRIWMRIVVLAAATGTEPATAVSRTRIQDDTLVAAGIVRGARVVLVRAL